MATVDYLHNDADAIYTRCVLAGIKISRATCALIASL